MRQSLNLSVRLRNDLNLRNVSSEHLLFQLQPTSAQLNPAQLPYASEASERLNVKSNSNTHFSFSTNCLLLCQPLYDPLLPFSPQRIDGIGDRAV